ncbi:gated mechanosensitive channel, partial [Rhizoclosmatium globosum]
MTDNVTSNVSQGLKKTASATMGVGEAFAAFINRGSVVDLAIGVVMGAAFTAIVTSFVNDLITPIIGLIGQKNLENLFLVMHCGGNSTICRTGSDHPYATVKEAAADRAATWNYGNFIQAVINFFLIALCMFFLVQLYSNTFLKMTKKPALQRQRSARNVASHVQSRPRSAVAVWLLSQKSKCPSCEAPVVAAFPRCST